VPEGKLRALRAAPSEVFQHRGHFRRGVVIICSNEDAKPAPQADGFSPIRSTGEKNPSV
jgi:hypothetical protein